MTLPEHVHLDGPALVELALAPARERIREQVGACAHCSTALAEEERTLGDLRRAFADAPDERSARFAERVLRTTTREDLSWRGSAALLTRFARDRVARSRPLRWLAASILIHALALPVLAFVAWRELREERAFRTGIERAEELLPQQPAEPERPLELVEPELPDLPPDPGPPRVFVELEIDNALALARFELADLVARPPSSALAPSTRAGTLLALRAGLARSRSAPQDLAALPEPVGDPLEPALRAEILLDAFSFSRTASPGLELALAQLAGSTGSGPELDALNELALERARSYGLLAARLDGGAGRVRPLAPRWFDALERAAAASGALGDPQVQAWIDWGRARAADSGR